LARSDTARTRRPKGVVAWFQYQVFEYESAGPAEDHTLSLRRASRVSALKGGTGDYAIGWKRPSKIEKKPSAIPSKVSLDGLGWAPIAHPSPTKSPSIPIQNAFGWAVGRR